MAGRSRSRQGIGTVRLLLLLSGGLLLFGVLWNTTRAFFQGRQKRGLGGVQTSVGSQVSHSQILSEDTSTLFLLDSEDESDVEDISRDRAKNQHSNAAASVPTTQSVPIVPTPQRLAQDLPASRPTLSSPHSSKPIQQNIQSALHLPIVEDGRQAAGTEMPPSPAARAASTSFTTEPATPEARSSPISAGPPVCYGMAPLHFPERQSIEQTARLQWLALGGSALSTELEEVSDSDEEASDAEDSDGEDESNSFDAGSALDAEEAEEESEEETALTGTSRTGLKRAYGRSLLARNKGAKSTEMGVGCGKSKVERVPHENLDRLAPKPRKNTAGKENLIKCLTNVTACNGESLREAGSLSGIQALKKLPVVRLGDNQPARFKSCALVGNAGSMVGAKQGKYIDQHEVVVRFNIMPTSGFEEDVGSKTSFRILNHRRSLSACCRGNFPEAAQTKLTGISNTTLMIWFPGAQKSIAARCKESVPGQKVALLHIDTARAMARRMNALRREMQALGMQGFGDWRQMTSGGHSIMIFLKLCDTLNVYGFTTFPPEKKKGPDQYGGRQERANSGNLWHDFKGEAMVW